MYLNQSFNSFFQHRDFIQLRSYMRKAGASARTSWLGGGQRPLDRGIGLRSPGKPDELGKSERGRITDPCGGKWEVFRFLLCVTAAGVGVGGSFILPCC